MNKKLKTDAVDHLFQAVLCLKTQDECYSFFGALGTVTPDVSRDRRKDRRLDSHHKPCQPLFKLRKRRLRADLRPSGIMRGLSCLFRIDTGLQAC